MNTVLIHRFYFIQFYIFFLQFAMYFLNEMKFLNLFSSCIFPFVVKGIGLYALFYFLVLLFK